MEILRVFNNNVVLARNDAGQETILTGRGLGFQAKPGHQVDGSKIVRVFVPENGRDPDNFGAVVAAIPPEHLLLADQALKAASAEYDGAGLDKSVGSTLLVALADHLSFAIKRVRQDIRLEYPLQSEVMHLYPHEFRTARKVVDFVNGQLDVHLPAEEAVAVALHLVNAGFSTGNLSYTYRMTGVLTQLFEVLETAYGREFDRDSVNTARFITHLRYFFVRAHSGKQLNEGNSKLFTAIQEAYPADYATAIKLQSVLELRLDQELTDDEVAYLTLHVARMADDSRH
ncbi:MULTISPECIES: PRD domain-containing protein [Arthrobacter]|uniref:PRD domain-containing protein n=2 Tax=Arthrobacter TaxID=1663 RepID=A0ABU9KGU5_9MICC|nr:PRD domain-containing protein [Arthrobacter sp. YJM1]MDP5225766.1 PRD domain-containing protein [Arthrobacter sp. YJM1]